VYLLKNFVFHADIMILMRAKEGAIGADTNLIINTNDLKLSLMRGAKKFRGGTTFALHIFHFIGLVLDHRGTLARSCPLGIVIEILGM
jgi:hypothetical protein